MIVIPLVLLLAVSAWSESIWSDEYCPPEKDVGPCYCFDEYMNKSSVLCSSKSVEEIQGVLSRIKGNDVHLSLEFVRFENISSNFFEGQIFSKISFNYCKFRSRETIAFNGLEDYLQELQIYSSLRGNSITNWNLSNLNNLQELIIEKNDIPMVSNELFRGAPENLQTLQLNENEIQDLGDEAFVSLTKLEVLILENNHIVHVQRSMFPKSSQLTELDLSYNYITDLPIDFFDDMTKLQGVHLENNYLTALTKEPWEVVWSHLEAVDVDNNPIVCDRKLRWIYQRDSLPESFTGRCRYPRALRNRYLDELKDTDFDRL